MIKFIKMPVMFDPEKLETNSVRPVTSNKFSNFPKVWPDPKLKKSIPEPTLLKVLINVRPSPNES